MAMSRPASFDTPTPRRLTRESILQHAQPTTQEGVVVTRLNDNASTTSSSAAWSLSNLLALLRMNLFTHRHSLGLVGSAVYGAATRRRASAGGAGSCLIRTPGWAGLISRHTRPVQNRREWPCQRVAS